jgi:chaperone required for assembly of F1-ATPase
MKRLYVKVQTVQTPHGFAVALDDRPIKTPGRWPLVLPTRALAEGIAGEWREQGTSVRPETMPLMQLAATVLDHVAIHRAEVEAATLRFAETDLVCYRAEAPSELVRLQRAHWEPLLDWLKDIYGVRLVVTAGILPIAQPSEAILALGSVVRSMDEWRLGAFQSATAASGSFVIGLALMDGRIDTDQAFAAAELDETYGIEHWGDDPVAAQRRATVAADLAAARRFRDLLGD